MRQCKLLVRGLVDVQIILFDIASCDKMAAVRTGGYGSSREDAGHSLSFTLVACHQLMSVSS